MIYNKINIPTEVSTEHDVNDVLDNIIAIWEACEKIKNTFLAYGMQLVINIT